ncbi:MAG: helix-turn-helix transcriptional regulator [Clostridiales bacterium]|nr:helix-turn-helix transcriptional regulator [Clostridiales bacterium]
MDTFFYVPKEKAITIILRPEEDGLHICYASEYYCQLISSPFPYNKDELFSKYISEYYYNALINICQELESCAESYIGKINYSYQDIFIPLYIHIISYKYNAKTYFIFTANDTNHYDFFNSILVDHEANSILTTYRPILKNPNTATVIYNCEDPKHPKIERVNMSTLELAAHTSLFLQPCFREDKLLYTILETKLTIEDQITIHQNHTQSHYKIYGIPILDHNIVSKILMIIVNSSVPTKEHSLKLTPRENEVIQYVLMGVKNDYIARKLNVSTGTIKRTISNVYNKLGISSRVELINYYHSLENDKA